MPQRRMAPLIFVLALGVCLSSAADTKLVAWGNGPSAPADLTNAVAIAAGDSYNLALRTDGTVTAWGTGGGTNVPPDLTNALAVAAHSSFWLALRSDRTVAAWGPSGVVPPANLADVVAISAGQSHAAALKRDGSNGAKPISRRTPAV